MSTFIYRNQLADNVQMEDITPEQRATFQAHLAYLTQAARDGLVIFNGTCTNFAFGVVVFEAKSIETAQLFMENDPAIAAGLMMGELHPFQVTFPSS